MNNASATVVQSTAQCPECGGTVPIAHTPLAGEVLPCPGCGVELEVTSTNPVAFTLAPQVEEDWGE